MQAQAQHVKADMDQLVKLFAKSKYLAPHTPKLMRHKRVLLPHLQLLTPHRSICQGAVSWGRPVKGRRCWVAWPRRRDLPSDLPRGERRRSCRWLSTPQG